MTHIPPTATLPLPPTVWQHLIPHLNTDSLPSEVGNLQQHPPRPPTPPPPETQWQNTGREILKNQRCKKEKKRREKETISRRIICAWLEIKADDSSTAAQRESELFHTASGASHVLSVSQTFRPTHKRPHVVPVCPAGTAATRKSPRRSPDHQSQVENVCFTGASFCTKDLGGHTRVF